MKTFLSLKFKIPEESFDNISAWASGSDGFLGLEEGFDELTLWFSDEPGRVDQLKSWLVTEGARLGIKDSSLNYQDDQNWNAVWEAGIKPILIDDHFCIFPGWAKPKQDFPVMIRIDPKMSFGTGYHETTRLMLKAMKNLDFNEKRVLDCGTGTGVLAIAAARLGSGNILAFDIDHWSVENTQENLELNGVVPLVTLKEGDFSCVSGNDSFHIILSNVNRNIHLNEISFYKNHLDSNGRLLLSGLLVTDRHTIENAFEAGGFTQSGFWQENEWIALEYRR